MNSFSVKGNIIQLLMFEQLAIKNKLKSISESVFNFRCAYDKPATHIVFCNLNPLKYIPSGNSFSYRTYDLEKEWDKAELAL